MRSLFISMAILAMSTSSAWANNVHMPQLQFPPATRSGLETGDVVLAPTKPFAEDNFEKRWSWTGFSAGVDLGYSWQSDVTNSGPCFNTNCEAEGSGSAFGVYAGYNRQFDFVVAGIEASYAYLGNDFDDGSGISFRDSIALKARLGLAYGRFHAYGTIGAAYGSTDAPAALSAFEDRDWGVVYGVGVDVAITDAVFTGVQYTHQSYEGFAGLPIDANANKVVARLGYKF